MPESVLEGRVKNQGYYMYASALKELDHAMRIRSVLCVNGSEDRNKNQQGCIFPWNI